MLEAEAKERQRASGEIFGRGKVSQKFDEPIAEYMGGILERPRDDGRAAEQAAQIVGTNS